MTESPPINIGFDELITYRKTKNILHMNHELFKTAGIIATCPLLFYSRRYIVSVINRNLHVNYKIRFSDSSSIHSKLHHAACWAAGILAGQAFFIPAFSKTVEEAYRNDGKLWKHVFNSDYHNRLDDLTEAQRYHPDTAEIPRNYNINHVKAEDLAEAHATAGFQDNVVRLFFSSLGQSTIPMLLTQTEFIKRCIGENNKAILPKFFDKFVLKNKNVSLGWNLLSFALGAYCFERILQVRHDAFKYEWYYKNNMVAIEDQEVDIVDLIREMHSESQIREHVLVRSEFSPEESSRSAASLIKEVIDEYKENEDRKNDESEENSEIDQKPENIAETHQWKTWEETK